MSAEQRQIAPTACGWYIGPDGERCQNVGVRAEDFGSRLLCAYHYAAGARKDWLCGAAPEDGRTGE
jgi:hypothetical protein